MWQSPRDGRERAREGRRRKGPDDEALCTWRVNQRRGSGVIMMLDCAHGRSISPSSHSLAPCQPASLIFGCSGPWNSLLSFFFSYYSSFSCELSLSSVRQRAFSSLSECCKLIASEWLQQAAWRFGSTDGWACRVFRPLTVAFGLWRRRCGGLEICFRWIRRVLERNYLEMGKFLRCTRLRRCARRRLNWAFPVGNNSSSSTVCILKIENFLSSKQFCVFREYKSS